MNIILEKYNKEIVPAMQKQFGYKNAMLVPKITKVIVHVGVGKSHSEPKLVEEATDTLTKITGQKPLTTLAKKSISAFKLREGMPIGLKVTLRGNRMYDFINRLVNVTLPRVKDFHGIPASFDGNGNLTIGLKEQLIFPEIKAEETALLHGLEITVVTTAKTNEEAFQLCRSFGLPLKPLKK